jgi:hypothetical protein
MSDMAAGAASGAATARQYLDINDMRLPGDLDPKTAVIYVAQCQLAIAFVYLFPHGAMGIILSLVTCCFAGCGIAGAWLPNRKLLLMVGVRYSLAWGLRLCRPGDAPLRAWRTDPSLVALALLSTC